MSTIFFVIQSANKAIQAIVSKNDAIKKQKGAIIIEYAWLGVLIAVVVAGTVQLIGEKVLDMLTTAANAFP